MSVTEGDSIHHPHHGLGEVQSIRTRSFSGDNKTRFAKMFFKRDKVTLMIREADLGDTVRPPIDASEASKLLKHIKKWQGKVSSQWKARVNAHQKTLEEGSPYGYAEVFKDLTTMEQEGKLRMMDRAHLNQSAQFLSEELANALGKSQDEIRDQMAKVAHTEPVEEQHL